MDIIDLTIEIWIGNQSQGKQRMQLPSMIVDQECNKLVGQIVGYPAPAKIKFSQPYYTDSGKIIEQSISFVNNKYLNEFGEGGV